MIPKCVQINSDPDKKAAAVISEPKVSEFKEKILDPRTTGCYKPPAIPKQEVFEAVVSCVGDDGTIFVVPKVSGKVCQIMKCYLVKAVTSSSTSLARYTWIEIIWGDS